MFFQDIACPWWWASSHFSSPFFFFALICRRLPKIPVACFLPFLNGSLLWWYISKILKFLLHYVSNMIVQGTGAAVQDVINFVVNRHFGGGNLTGEVVTKQKAQWSNISLHGFLFENWKGELHCEERDRERHRCVEPQLGSPLCWVGHCGWKPKYLWPNPCSPGHCISCETLMLLASQRLFFFMVDPSIV